VHGAGSSMKYRIAYWSGPLNVTADVVAGTFTTDPLGAGESEYLLAFIYVRPTTRSGSFMTDPISVRSMAPVPVGKTAPMDAVSAKVLVNRRAGDFNSQRPDA